MCFGLGLAFFVAVIEFLPYIFLVNVPLLGSFYGVDTIYRLSILLIVHSLLVECFPKFLFRVVPLFSLIIFITIINLPISLTPYPLVWLYDKVIWLTEPLLMLAEVVLSQNFIMRYSQSAADEIEKREDSSFLYKAGILVFSSLCYAVAASVAYEIYSNAASSQVLCLFVVFCLLIALHNMTLMAHEGIISDCAFCSLISVSILYVMVSEAKQINSPLAEPLLWNQASQPSSSVSSILYSILNMSSANAHRSTLYLKRFFSPLFLCLLAIRLYSIIFIVNKATRNFFRSQNEDIEISELDYDHEVFSPWKSPLLLKISIIFMLTQMSSNFLEEWSGHANKMSWLVEITTFEWTSQVLVSRLAQILIVSGFYMWRLYRAENWAWNPWLT